MEDVFVEPWKIGCEKLFQSNVKKQEDEPKELEKGKIHKKEPDKDKEADQEKS